jgi:hypothetical protein
MKNVFPYILMTLDFGAAIVYGFQGDYWRAVYWISAGMLTLTTTRF